MANDHYIAQTYLKHFGDHKTQGMLHAYRKSDGAKFACWPKDVCREWDGDLNPKFLAQRPELLGNLRKTFESGWNRAIAGLISENISTEDKFNISGYMANLMTCTPAWRRVGVEMYSRLAIGYMSFYKKMKQKHGGPSSLPLDAIELVEKGELKIGADPDYLKAVVTNQLLDASWLVYNQDWVILKNETNQPFITSDNPVATSYSGKIGVPAIKYLSLTPHLCLMVTCRNDAGPFSRDNPSSNFTKPPLGTIVGSNVSTADAKRINRLIVQCADDLVFSAAKSDGIALLVKKYSKFRVEVDYAELPTGELDSMYQASIIRIREAKNRK